MYTEHVPVTLTDSSCAYDPYQDVLVELVELVEQREPKTNFYLG